jgi:divalent metal cation (Fe/Co/Zn/Cd) transporter
VFGLTALFIFVVGMVVALGATCFLVYQRKMTKVLTVIIVLVAIQISFYVLLHYVLLVDIIGSTYLSRFIFRSGKSMFC